jgi:hypothetical protein
MMLLLGLLLATVSVSNSLFVGTEKVFYVEPTGSRTECPSYDSPCYSLQYYANDSLTIFTNNSKFLFLEGEHHLDGVVNISNVANLSLVGASLKVKIVLGTHPSGFHFQELFGLKIENLNISSYSQSTELARDTAVGIVYSSEISFNRVSLHYLILVLHVEGTAVTVTNIEAGGLILRCSNVPCTVHILNTTFNLFQGNLVSIILNNSTAELGQSIFLTYVVIHIVNCSFENRHQAINAVSSNLTFEGQNVFRNNTGYRGAGITLTNSFMDLLPGTHVIFENNHADDVGAAIHTNVLKSERKIINCPETARMTFTNNTAPHGGTSIYVYGEYRHHDSPVDCEYGTMHNSDEDPSAISGDPSYVYLCGKPSTRSKVVYVRPGQEFSLYLMVASAVCDGAVPGIITAIIQHPNATLGSQSQSSQASTTPSCNHFIYSIMVFNTTESVVLTLHVQ